MKQLSRFDAGLRCSLESITHSSIPDLSWKQATLPVRLGGLGLRDSTRTSPSLQVAIHLVLWCLVCCLGYKSLPPLSVHHSARTCFSKVNVLQTINYVASYLPSKTTFRMSTQRQLQSILDSAMWHSIRDNASLRDRARLNTISAQHAGAWLRAVPNPNIGLAMPQKEFTISLRLWLGIPLFPSDLGSKRCFCGQILDQFGDHLLGCGHNNLRIRRHDTLSDVLFHALLVDNANCRKEQRCSSDNSTRPDDVFTLISTRVVPRTRTST